MVRRHFGSRSAAEFSRTQPLPWMEAANCVRWNVDPEIFYAPSHSRIALRSQICIPNCAMCKALRTCRRCPVKAECLEYVMTAERTDTAFYRSGIYAGLTGDERYRLQRKRNEEKSA